MLPATDLFGYTDAMTLETLNKQIVLTAFELQGVAVSTIKAVIGDVRYQYLSGPITGGRRLLDWHDAVGRVLPEADYKAAKQCGVVKENIAAVQAAATHERNAGRNTIEPGSFEDFEHWDQDDFLRFWEEVIANHSSHVRFMDGWQFSSGCAFELLCARRHDRPSYAMNGQILTNEMALTLLDEALVEISGRYDPMSVVDHEIARLHAKISSSRAAIAALG